MSLKHLILPLLVFLIIAPTIGFLPPPDDDDKKVDPMDMVTEENPFSLISDFLAWPSRTDMGRAATAVDRLHSMNPEDIGPKEVYRFYEEVGKDRVRMLSNKGIRYEGKLFRISPAHSKRLAEVRNSMRLDTWKRTGQRLETDITLVNYGNKAAHSGSDVDETGFVARDDSRMKDLDIKEEFAKDWAVLYGDLASPGGKADPKVMDLEIHDGRERFPDVFGDETLGVYKMTYVDIVKRLKANPGGYHFEGAVKLEVEQASAKKMEKFLRRAADLKSQLEAGNISAERKRQLTAELDLLRQESPCTKISPRPDGTVDVVKDADIVDEIFRLADPEVLHFYGCDSAWGNYLKAMACKNMVEGHKHIVRSLTGTCIATGPRRAVDFMPLAPGEKQALIKQLYPDSMGFSDRDRHEALLALDIAQKLRTNKTKQGTTYTDEQIWKPLEQYLGADRRRNRRGNKPLVIESGKEDMRRWAMQEFDRMGKKVLAFNNAVTAMARGEAALSPDKLKNSPEFQAVCKNRGADPDLVMKKIQFASVCALKDGFVGLPRRQVDRIINSLPEGEYKKNLNLLRNQVEIEMSRLGRLDIDPEKKGTIGRLFDETLREIKEEWVLKNYFDFEYALRSGFYSPEAVTKRFWDRIYDMAGYEYKLVFNDISEGIDGSIPRDGVDRFEQGDWSPDKAFANVVNMNNLEAALSVLKTWQQTGDFNATMRSLIMEVLYEIPGFSHMMALREGFVHGRWEGVQLISSATLTQMFANFVHNAGWGCLVPYEGAIFVFISVAKTSVEIVGHEIFEPLREDLADMIYTGYSGIVDSKKTAPPEFSSKDKAKKSDVGNRLDKVEDELTKAAKSSSGVDKGDLDERAKKLRKEMDALSKKQSAWERHKEDDNWRAGAVRTGRSEIKSTAFKPVLSAVKPEFYVSKEKGIIDLKAEPPTPQELNRLDSLNILVDQLRESAHGFNPIERVEKLCDYLDQRDVLLDKKFQYERRVQLVKEMDKNLALELEVLRQNVFSLIHPEVQKAMLGAGHPEESRIRDMSEKQSADYFKAKEGMEERIVKAHVQKWLATIEVGGLDYGGHNRDAWKHAPKRVAARMLGDYRASSRLNDLVFDYGIEKLESMNKRQEKRRHDLVEGALHDAMAMNTMTSADAMADFAALCMAHRPPAPRPIVRLYGVVQGEKKEKEVAWRVKIIASHKAYPPPYTVEIHATADTSKAGKNQKREIEARVYCMKEGRRILVGTDRIPVALEKLGETRKVETARDPLLPVRLKVEPVRVTKLADFFSHQTCTLEGALSPAEPGWHRISVRCNKQSYTVWAHCAGRGGSAAFSAKIPLVYVKQQIEIIAPGAEPVTMEVEPESAYGPSKAQIFMDQIAKCRRSLASAETPEDRISELKNIVWRGCDLVKDLVRHDRFEEALKHARQLVAEIPGAAELKGTRHEGSFDYNMDVLLNYQVQACFFLGDKAGMLKASNQWLAQVEDRVARARAAGGANKTPPKNYYDEYTRHLAWTIKGWLLQGGDPATARKLYRTWVDLCKKLGWDENRELSGFYNLTNLDYIVEKEYAVH